MEQKLTEQIDFYRNLGFFDKYKDKETSELTPILKKQAEKGFFGELTADSGSIDWIILSLDTDKVFYTEDFMTFKKKEETEEEMYLRIFEILRHISNEKFNFSKFKMTQKGYCSGRDKRWHVSFEYNYRNHEIMFCGDLSVLVFDWISRINDILVDEKRKFVYAKKGYGDMIITFIDDKVVNKLSEKFKFVTGKDYYYWQDIGDYYYDNEDYTTAEIYYIKALKVDSKQWFAVSQLANCYSYDKKDEKCIDLYKEAILNLSNAEDISQTDEWYLNFFKTELERLENK